MKCPSIIDTDPAPIVKLLQRLDDLVPSGCYIVTLIVDAHGEAVCFGSGPAEDSLEAMRQYVEVHSRPCPHDA